ncbi:MAG: hypothetical protein Q4G36_08510 [Paracoccus sp. (in: a-proteobacteria)]|nr:hypothetical protein [Paracoccus sp. (in: a-proteobacteria)]
MSELAQPLSPPSRPAPGSPRGSESEHIGDVLASIRQLIAQEDGMPDFAPRASRADSLGVIRPTMPLGPRSERLRGVIAQELAALEDAFGTPEADPGDAPLILDEAAMVPASDTPTTEKDELMNVAELHRNDNVARSTEQDDGFDLFALDMDEGEDPVSGGNALRSLVRDVIRQEFQGDMGDRISRNLRRVVRQEVAAAISAGLKV